MTSTSRSARLAKWLSVPLGLVISALLIWQASYAAFSDTVTSPDNTWTTGTVTLTRDNDGKRLFNEQNLAPGDTGFQDVTVTYDGTLDATVKFYGTEPGPGQLAEYIELEVRGSWGETYDERPEANGLIWEGSLAEFAATHNAYGNGIEFDAPRSLQGQTGTFRFTYTVTEPPLLVEDLTAETAKIDFVLESRNS